MACSGIDCGADSRWLAAADLPPTSLVALVGDRRCKPRSRQGGWTWLGRGSWLVSWAQFYLTASRPTFAGQGFFSPLARFWRLSGGHLDPAISGMTEHQRIAGY
jgi:hypothetical protein